MNFFNQNENQNQTETLDSARQTVTPRYQVRETPEAFVVVAHVPGAERSSVVTTVHGESLSVTASKSSSVPAEWTPLHRESSAADYRLVLELDHRVNRDAVTAELSQGVLTLTVPKAETVKPRRIEIQG